MRNVKDKINKINLILDEIKSYETYKNNLFRKLDSLFSDYQKKRYTHEQYKQVREELLENKTKKEWADYYNAYIYSLLKKVEELNYELFYEVYENKDFNKIKITHKIYKRKILQEKNKKKKEVDEFDKEFLENLLKIEAYELKKQKQKQTSKKIQKAREKKQFLDIQIPYPNKRQSKEKEKLISLKKGKLELPKELKQKQRVSVAGTFGLNFIKTLLKRASKKEKTQERKTILDLKLDSKSQKPLFEKIGTSEFSSSVISEEAKRIKSILERRKTSAIYQPSFFGALANIMIKRVSFFLLDTFPELFKNLYNGLRLANIKILSNTYVNIMVLFTVVFSFIAIPLSFLFFIRNAALVSNAVVKTIFTTLIIATITFMGFFSYPFVKVGDRRRNVNANLPFAINHMAAVSGSGVPPTRMFQLIADSTEYGEVSIEVAKIVEYIELFGYDFLTSLKSVAAISPSPQFKDFLESLVSTVESGGDIKEYLAQKADEAMLNYELERQKYIESISTYSDVYTGILIAAPLFFVTALSMVSMLGGAIGGVDVNVVTVVGTYVVVPLLNIAFLVFLEITQPEI